MRLVLGVPVAERELLAANVRATLRAGAADQYRTSRRPSRLVS